jgi:hypothetical protein
MQRAAFCDAARRDPCLGFSYNSGTSLGEALKLTIVSHIEPTLNFIYNWYFRTILYTKKRY